LKNNFCIFCHFESDYSHYHIEQKWFSKNFVYFNEDEKTGKITEDTEEFWYLEPVRILDGNWTDENKICLPCQVARRFNV